MKADAMRTGLIVAMDKEYDRFVRLLADAAPLEAGAFKCIAGHIGGLDVALMRCGIGKVHAALGANALVGLFRPGIVISSGVAGGLDATLHPGDVVAATEIAYHDVWCGEGNVLGQVQGLPPRFACAADAVEAARRGGARTGLVVSGDRFVQASGELSAIKAAFPEALAVDMESGAIAQTCHILGVPFLALRAISDVVGDSSQASQYKGFWDTLAERSFDTTRLIVSSLAS